jgi:Holliday junction resolvase RusA-like endonuclease
MITITIPNWHPTPLNKLINGHWAIAAKRKKADRNLIYCYTRHLPEATKKCRVHVAIILGKGQRACDPDAYWKSLNDALVHAKMLVNDSHKWVELMPIKFTRGEMATIIRLEYLEAAKWRSLLGLNT